MVMIVILLAVLVFLLIASGVLNKQAGSLLTNVFDFFTGR